MGTIAVYIDSPNIQLQAIDETMFLWDKFQNSTLYFLTFEKYELQDKWNINVKQKQRAIVE